MYRFSSRGKKLLFLFLLLFLFGTILLVARAGGAGGSSGGGGSYGDSDSGLIVYLIYLIFRYIPFPFNVLLIIALIVLFKFSQKKVKNNQRAFTQPLSNSGGTNKKLNLDLPGTPFNEEDFLQKARKAFSAIQEGWSKQKLSGVRRYISDGIHQRFQTQFKMMEILQQRNELSDLVIQQVWIEKAEIQGPYQTVHCGFRASVTDKFLSPLFPQLNSGGRETFTEYWTFIRRQDSTQGDLYGSVKCPSCGAPLEEENLDVVSCPFCSTLLNNGSYDWILSEITQLDDWAASHNGMRKLEQVNARLQARIDQEDFSIQQLEDKASNGFLQIKTALTLKKPELMRKFLTQGLWDQLASSIPENPLAYSRLYLNHVTLIGADSDENRDILYMAVKSSYQRVQLHSRGKAKLLDPFMMAHQEVLKMERSASPGRPKGSLYGDRCPGCGSPIQDSSALECPSCGEAYNSGRWDWVISGILTMEEYQQEKEHFQEALPMDLLDSLYHWKDYVLNNLMLLIAADGKFTQEEKALARKISRKLGYNPSMLDSLYQQAASRRLVIRMPQEKSAQVKIFKLMDKMARIDRDFSQEEAALLGQVKDYYQIAI